MNAERTLTRVMMTMRLLTQPWLTEELIKHQRKFDILMMSKNDNMTSRRRKVPFVRARNFSLRKIYQAFFCGSASRIDLTYLGIPANIELTL